MPEYLVPGVYVEEFEIGPKPIEGVSTSTAGFLGQTERGPISPTLVTGFEEYNRIFGGYIDNSYLTYAIDGFFRNGGKRCYVCRITRTSPQDASQRAQSSEATIPVGGSSILVRAIGPGTWGNRLFYKIEDPTQQDTKNSRFKLTLMYFNSDPSSPVVDPTDPKNRKDPNRKEPAWLEIYDNISVDPKSSSFYKNETQGSHLVMLFDNIPTSTTSVPPNRPDNTTGLQQIQGANDGQGDIDIEDYKAAREDPLTDPLDNSKQIGVLRSGLLGLTEIEDISIVCAPDEPEVNGLRDELIDHCEILKYRFAVLQSKRSDVTNIGGLEPDRESKYAALYFPWVNVFDPLTGNQKLVPPGGYVCGIYARSDTERGVHKAPANELVRGATSLQIQVTKDQQAILNPRGVNVIRAFPGRGILVWGARTISRDTLWKYVNVRRLFIFIERSIDEGSQWLVFEVNNEKLWSRVKATITQFLTRVWRDGALMGTTPEEAFFVKCDRTTMTQDDLDNGRLIVIIGIAPVKPAEFVIFRIAQTRSGAEVTEV